MPFFFTGESVSSRGYCQNFARLQFVQVRKGLVRAPANEKTPEVRIRDCIVYCPKVGFREVPFKWIQTVRNSYLIWFQRRFVFRRPTDAKRIFRISYYRLCTFIRSRLIFPEASCSTYLARPRVVAYRTAAMSHDGRLIEDLHRMPHIAKIQLPVERLYHDELSRFPRRSLSPMAKDNENFYWRFTPCLMLTFSLPSGSSGHD